MNSTNRGLNRLLVLIVGLLLLAAGVGAILLAALPGVMDAWRSSSRTLESDPQPWVAQPVVGQASWLVLAVAAVAIVLVVLLIAFIARQGRGRSATALRQQEGGGRTVVDVAVPRALLEEHLRRRPEIVGLRISAYEVQDTPMLKITARCRRGTSPAVVADLVGRAVRDLEQILGTDVPALVQLTGGFRAGDLRRPQVS